MSSNRGAFQAVIYILGAALLLCVIGVCVLAALDVPLPDLLKEIGVGALAGLGGMLTHPPSGDPQPVVVQQPVDSPVPVDTDPTDEGLDEPPAAPRARRR